MTPNPQTMSLSSAGPSTPRRRNRGPVLDPLEKRRKALEKKAEAGDAYANRELRENHDYWYGQAGRDDALREMSAHQLAGVRALAEDALEPIPIGAPGWRRAR